MDSSRADVPWGVSTEDTTVPGRRVPVRIGARAVAGPALEIVSVTSAGVPGGRAGWDTKERTITSATGTGGMLTGVVVVLLPGTGSEEAVVAWATAAKAGDWRTVTVTSSAAVSPALRLPTVHTTCSGARRVVPWLGRRPARETSGG